MVTKKFVIDAAERSANLFEFRKDILTCMRELSLVLEASHYCRNIDEIKEFLK